MLFRIKLNIQGPFSALNKHKRIVGLRVSGTDKKKRKRPKALTGQSQVTNLKHLFGGFRPAGADFRH